MAGREVYVDTSAWYPFVFKGRTPSEHEEHRLVKQGLLDLVRLGLRLITTNLVVAETHQLLLRRHGRDVALAFLRSLPSPGTDVVPSSAALERRALEDWIERYEDQDFSLADAVGFVVMRDRGIRRALTLDRHFAAAGFEVIPLG